MLIRLILELFKTNIKGRYSNKIHYLTEFIAILVSLLIYYYTSKAFSGHLSSPLLKYKTDYFSFIVFGELILALPMYFLEGTFRQVETSYYEGIWETFNSFSISIPKKLLLITSYGVFPVLFRIILTFLLAYLFFDFKINIISLLQCLFFQILSIPVFLAPGIMACSLWMATGRGKSVIGYFTTITGILSGALFPLSVFPSWLVNISYYLSPFTFLLENGRMILLNPIGAEELISKSMILILWSGLLPLSFYLFKKAELKYKENDGIATMIF